VADFAFLGLELPKTHRSGHPAQRDGHPALETGTVAGIKKKPNKSSAR
jgi:hypothetical protein